MAYAACRKTFKRLGMAQRSLETTCGSMNLYDRPRASGRGGPTWVFLHGFASQSEDWASLLTHAASSIDRIVCLDLPGHGGTVDVPAGMPPIETVQRMCVEAIDALAAEDGFPVVCVGFSIGALATAVYGSARPQNTANVALLSPITAMRPESLDVVMRGFSPKTHKAARWTVETFMPAAPMKSLLAWGLLHTLAKPSYQRLLAAFATYRGLRAEHVRKLPEGALICCGDQDAVAPAECREFFFANAPASSELHQPKDWSHFTTMFKPAETASLLLDWGKRHGLLTTARGGKAAGL